MINKSWVGWKGFSNLLGNGKYLNLNGYDYFISIYSLLYICAPSWPLVKSKYLSLSTKATRLFYVLPPSIRYFFTSNDNDK